MFVSFQASCVKCYFNGDENEDNKSKIDCKDGCVNVTKEGKSASSRNCWNKIDGQEEGCNKNGDEEICYCLTELCNFGEKSRSDDDDDDDDDDENDEW